MALRRALSKHRSQPKSVDTAHPFGVRVTKDQFAFAPDMGEFLKGMTMAAFGEQSYRNMAHRMDVAECDFLETLMRCGGISREEATKVFVAYRKAKVLHNDYAISRISVKHGAFLDKEVIQRALNS